MNEYMKQRFEEILKLVEVIREGSDGNMNKLLVRFVVSRRIGIEIL